MKHIEHLLLLQRVHDAQLSEDYKFPVKRLLLTRDPKDRSVGGNSIYFFMCDCS